MFCFWLNLVLSQVFHCLNEILELCHSFCSLVSQNLGPLDERGAAQLDILVKVVALLVLIFFLNYSKCKIVFMDAHFCLMREGKGSCLGKSNFIHRKL